MAKPHEVRRDDGTQPEDFEDKVFSSLPAARECVKDANTKRGIDGDELIIDDGSKIQPVTPADLDATQEARHGTTPTN